MLIDCHVHISACTPVHGSISRKLFNSASMRFIRWRFGLSDIDERTERIFEQTLIDTLNDTPQLDAAAVLAFDAVHTPDGQLDPVNTHFHVQNDYVARLAKQHPKVLFGASIHPYRKDASAELERCAK